MHVLRRKVIFATAMSLNAFGLIAFGLPARAAEFNPAQKAEIEATIHSYLVEHPEVLREVSIELEKRQKVEEADLRSRAIADNKQRPVQLALSGGDRQSQGQDHAGRVLRL